ncbi:MAG: hypothetical protein ACREOK_04750 [Gemmatimonadaceae bacterium]
MTHRAFRDHNGRTWDVWEVHPTMAERRDARRGNRIAVERRKHSQPRASLPITLRHGWLAFESRAERRRLAPIPADWSLMTDDQLAELLARADMKGKTRRLIE